MRRNRIEECTEKELKALLVIVDRMADDWKTVWESPVERWMDDFKIETRIRKIRNGIFAEYGRRTLGRDKGFCHACGGSGVVPCDETRPGPTEKKCPICKGKKKGK